MATDEGGRDRSDGTDRPRNPALVQVDTIAELHRRGEERVPRRQRVIEKLHERLGKPRSLWVTLGLIAAWIAYNAVATAAGWPHFDQAPFPALQTTLAAAALLMTIVIAIVQARQVEREDRRERLSLHASLLAEHKVSKVIALLEELRRDLPEVRDRDDPEARAMMESADAHEVLDAIEESLGE